MNEKIRISELEIGDCIYVPELNNIVEVVIDIDISKNNTYFLTFIDGRTDKKVTFKYHFNKKFFLA